jgi:hypothetical protein
VSVQPPLSSACRQGSGESARAGAKEVTAV